jgi:hypothetical protein
VLPDEDRSILDKFKMPSISDKVNDVIKSVSSKTESIVKDLVNAFIILVVNTLILPIGTMVLLWFVLRRLTDGR